MTTAELLGVVRRRWYLVLLGVVATGVVAALIASKPGVYSTRVDVVFFPSQQSDPTDANTFSTSADVIAMAGLVEREVNADRETSALTSQDVSLSGTGIRNGTQIRLPNAGGQWDYNFNSPMLTVQSVGSSAEQVVAERTRAVEEITGKLRELQDQEGALPANRITTRVVPDYPKVTYSGGHPTRALAGVVVIGAGLTLTVTVTVDHLLLLRRRRKADRAGSPSAASV